MGGCTCLGIRVNRREMQEPETSDKAENLRGQSYDKTILRFVLSYYSSQFSSVRRLQSATLWAISGNRCQEETAQWAGQKKGLCLAALGHTGGHSEAAVLSA